MIENYYDNSAVKSMQLKKLSNSSNNSAPENKTQPLFTAEQNNNIEQSAYSDIYEKADEAGIAEKYNQFLVKYGIKQESGSGILNSLTGIYRTMHNVSDFIAEGLKTAQGNLYDLFKKYGAYMQNGSAVNIQDNLLQNISPLNSSEEDISAKYNALIKQFEIEIPEIQNTLIETDAESAAEKKYAVPEFYNDKAGRKLAKAANRTAGTIGHCLRGVNNSLYKVYRQTINAPSAYMAADILASNNGIGKHFTEDAVPRNFLEVLPEGAIVVWDNNADGGGKNVSKIGRKHGHVSIALGNGLESSDHIQKQTVNRDAEFRVFYPNS